MRRMLSLMTGLLLVLGLTAIPAAAHHGPDPNLPERNPHALGLPQQFWEQGTEIAAIRGEDGQPIEFNGFFLPAVLADDLDFPDAFWLVGRVGGEEGMLVAVRIEGLEPTGEFRDDIAITDLVNPITGLPVEEGTGPGEFMWIQIYPHAHHVILHEGTPRERCVDVANGRMLPHPNQHNAVDIGTPSHTTPGGFANAGHELRTGTCP